MIRVMKRIAHAISGIGEKSALLTRGRAFALLSRAAHQRIAKAGRLVPKRGRS
jgi:hypothetical protein